MIVWSNSDELSWRIVEPVAAFGRPSHVALSPCSESLLVSRHTKVPEGGWAAIVECWDVTNRRCKWSYLVKDNVAQRQPVLAQFVDDARVMVGLGPRLHILDASSGSVLDDATLSWPVVPFRGDDARFKVASAGFPWRVSVLARSLIGDCIVVGCDRRSINIRTDFNTFPTTLAAFFTDSMKSPVGTDMTRSVETAEVMTQSKRVVVGESVEGTVVVSALVATGSVSIWDIESGEEVRNWGPLRDPVISVAVSESHDLIAFGTGPSRYDTSGASAPSSTTYGVFLLSMKETSSKPIPVGKSCGPQTAVVFCGRGNLLLSGGNDGTIRLWDVSSRRELGSNRLHRSLVTTICTLPDGEGIASASDDGAVIVWKLRSAFPNVTLVAPTEKPIQGMRTGPSEGENLGREEP